MIPPQGAARPVAPEIAEAYLTARTEFEKMSAEGIGNALQSFREITLKAPDFAPVLAWMNLLLDWDLDAALREARRAIELSPSETDAHEFYSTLLSFVGQTSESVREVQYMLRLNPAPLMPNQYAAWMLLHVGQHARAEAGSKRLTGSGTAPCSGSPGLRGSIPSTPTHASPISSIAWASLRFTPRLTVAVPGARAG